MSGPVGDRPEWRHGYAVKWRDRNPKNPQEMDALYLRNYGVTRTALNDQFLGPLWATLGPYARILEIGASAGVQLQILAQMGYRHLTACDLAADALATNPYPRTAADAAFLPFADNSFDMVFTSGALMHVPSAVKGQAMREMCRVSRQWVWGFELWSSGALWGRLSDDDDSQLRAILPYEHRCWPGHLPDAWLCDYSRIFQREAAGRPVLERFFGWADGEDAVHTMYLLEVG